MGQTGNLFAKRGPGATMVLSKQNAPPVSNLVRRFRARVLMEGGPTLRISRSLAPPTGQRAKKIDLSARHDRVLLRERRLRFGVGALDI